MLGISNRDHRNISIKIFIHLHKGIVTSHSDYCVSVWVPYKKAVIETSVSQCSTCFRIIIYFYCVRPMTLSPL